MTTNKKAKEMDRKPRKKPVNNLNDLTATEWIAETVSVWTQRGLGKTHKDAQIEKLLELKVDLVTRKALKPHIGKAILKELVPV